MPTVKGLKVTIGGPESPLGTEAARTEVIPIRSLPGLSNNPEKAEDPAIDGHNMLVGEYAMAEDVGGSIPISFRPCASVGKILKSLLGTETSPAQIHAIARIRYIGASASCKITAETSGDTLDSDVGALGSESADANFGTGGSISLVGAAFDTVAELVAVINAYADYEAEKLMGADAAVSANIISGTFQAADKWVYLFFTGTSGAYLHRFEADLTNTERPGYSLQLDGVQSNFLYTGAIVDQLTLNAALKGMVEAEAVIMAFAEADGEVASVATLDAVDPLIFWKGSASIGAVDYTNVRNVSGLAFSNNHNKDSGFGMGAIGRTAHEKGPFAVAGNIKLRLDADSYALRAAVTAGTQVAISLYFRGKAIGATGMLELCIIELPYCVISAAPFEENGPIVDINIGIKATYPAGTTYDDPVVVHFITADSGAY
jgi:hypothetical protein